MSRFWVIQARPVSGEAWRKFQCPAVRNNSTQPPSLPLVPAQDPDIASKGEPFPWLPCLNFWLSESWDVKNDYCLTPLSLGWFVMQQRITGVECRALLLDFVLLFVGGVLRSAVCASGLTQTQPCPFILQLRFLYWTKPLVIGLLLQSYESPEASPHADAH